MQKRVVFVNYGEFGNNSSNHISGFSRGLARRGHLVGIVADGRPAEFITGVRYATFAELEQGDGDGEVARMLADASTLLHVWTPRERVRRWVEPLARTGLRYVVHLEDDEDVVTHSQLRRSAGELQALDTADLDALIPQHLSHPTHFRSFLSAATGVTIISPALEALAPEDVPLLLLEPGVEGSFFNRGVAGAERDTRRAALGIGPHATVLVYHGGIHPAIQRDMFSLYTAVSKLRRAGHEVTLIRLGTSCDVSEVSTAFRRADGVVQVAWVPRYDLPGWLDLADIYVQPGAASVFNARRLPSKLLDFFAMGRPVILPRTGVGLRCKDGVDALLLRQGGAEEIMHCVLRLISDPSLMESVGRNGREFSDRTFGWDEKIAALEKFYEGL